MSRGKEKAARFYFSGRVSLQSPRILITWSEVNLGVPCSPNCDLDQLRIFRQIDVPRCEIQFYSLADIRPSLILGFAG